MPRRRRSRSRSRAVTSSTDDGRIFLSGRLKSAEPCARLSGFTFTIKATGTPEIFSFRLAPKKALQLCNAAHEFPVGVALRLSGRRHGTVLTHVKIEVIDGYDVQAWAERQGSPTVDEKIAHDARKIIAANDEKEMKLRAPPEPDPVFKTPMEAYEKGMFILRRQTKLKEPKLSKKEIWAVRDALNMLKKAAGL